MIFNSYIGIDYSGAGEPTGRRRNLQLYLTEGGTEPEQVKASNDWNWSRQLLAEWLENYLATHDRVIVGIDHGFSFPKSYMQRNNIHTWDQFLADFSNHWKTESASVESFRENNPRSGDSKEFRLTEQWTSSAKSVFLFDVNGSVAKSTHAGLPWLLQLRSRLGDRLHFWPVDGFDIPEGKSVVAEVYPSIFRNRYERDGRTGDEQDAYSCAAWMQQMDRNGFLTQYFHPPLTDEEKQVAALEGWILGVY
ncbi:hypothetical protein PDESU_06361 [Pontiella desulfatans]|uniref:DUF429 domain-containing protein n=1 Tax=Pontiella desulfatans TaxID=2750659 RepID=A0A6C2UCY2_PONDE|nr:hypothetical protein [Pontiella desulfatans]VGO17759.1 hypothetical protein PDESU_06361 [Pontiella desulfatans]